MEHCSGVWVHSISCNDSQPAVRQDSGYSLTLWHVAPTCSPPERTACSSQALLWQGWLHFKLKMPPQAKREVWNGTVPLCQMGKLRHGASDKESIPCACNWE